MFVQEFYILWPIALTAVVIAAIAIKDKISRGPQMSLEADAKAVVTDIVADAKAVVTDVKAEAEKIFAKAKVEAVAFDGSVAQEITKLKAAVSALDQSAAVKAIEAKVDAVIAKLGVKL